MLASNMASAQVTSVGSTGPSNDKAQLRARADEHGGLHRAQAAKVRQLQRLIDTGARPSGSAGLRRGLRELPRLSGEML